MPDTVHYTQACILTPKFLRPAYKGQDGKIYVTHTGDGYRLHAVYKRSAAFLAGVIYGPKGLIQHYHNINGEVLRCDYATYLDVLTTS